MGASVIRDASCPAVQLGLGRSETLGRSATIPKRSHMEGGLAILKVGRPGCYSSVMSFYMFLHCSWSPRDC